MTSDNVVDGQPDPAAVAGEHRLSQQVERTGMFGTGTTGDTSGYGGLRVRAPDPVPTGPTSTRSPTNSPRAWSAAAAPSPRR